MDGRRYAGIGLAVGMLFAMLGIIVVGPENEGALQAVAIATLFVTFGVYHGLDEWARRRARRDQ